MQSRTLHTASYVLDSRLTARLPWPQKFRPTYTWNGVKNAELVLPLACCAERNCPFDDV